MFILEVAALIVAWIGAVLAIKGRRGRAIDDHPICRHCGRDLFGLDSTQCPECGVAIDLRTGQNIRRGNRVRRNGLVWTGICILLVGLLVGGGATYVQIAKVDWIKYKPTSWLIEDVLDPTLKQWNASVKELRSRTLSKQDRQALIEKLLAKQADPSVTWQNEWGVWLDAAVNDDTMTSAQRERYFDNLFQPVTRARPRVSANGNLPIQTADHFRIAGMPSQKWVMHDLRYEVRTTDGTVVYRSTGGSASSVSGGSGGSSTSFIPVQGKLPVGEHDLDILQEFELHRGWEKDSEKLHAYKHSTRVHVKVEPEITVGWLTSSLTGDELRSHLKLAAGSGSSSTQPSPQIGLRQSDWGTSFDLQIVRKSLPVNLGVDIIVKVGDKSWTVTSIDMTPGDGTWGTGGGDVKPEDVEAIRGQSATVILHGSREAMERSIDQFETWQGDVVFENVEIRYVDQRTPKK
ncbi:MAG: hypothetical protein QM770_19915 [Tepidisphaeraceae bacterium]